MEAPHIVEPSDGNNNNNNNQDEEEEWDKNTDDINSIASDELRETRPNRWRGHPQTWRNFTEADREAWAMLEGVRQQDLAVHLYNAFKLRGAYQDENDGEGWEPPKNWTAWPMRADEVPDDGLMVVDEADEEGEEETLRGPGKGFPGSHLEEEISATVLRFAKERFLKRGLGVVKSVETNGEDDGDLDVEEDEEDAEEDEEDDEEDDEEGDEEDDEGDDDEEVDEEVDEEEDDEDVDKVGGAGPPQRGRKRAASPEFFPVVSANDELSYSLMRPAVRQILEKLDHTLTILHNSRVNSLHQPNDPSDSDADSEDDTDFRTPTPKRGRPRSQQNQEQRQESTGSPKRGGGRPKKSQVQREGETELEFEVRVARENKRRLPDSYVGQTQTEDEETPWEEKKKSRRMQRLERSKSRRSRSERTGSLPTSRSRSRPRSRSKSAGPYTQQREEDRIAVYALRDWRDVLSSAALAGFPATVLDRAAQRCALLFGQKMTLLTIPREPAGPGMTGVEATTYFPGPISSDEVDDDYEGGDSESGPGDELDDSEMERNRVVSCQPSAHDTSPAGNTITPKRVKMGITAQGKRIYLCTHKDCPRSVDGFGRPTNLVRHLQSMHGRGGRVQDARLNQEEDRPAPTARSMTATPSEMGFLCIWPGCERAVKGFGRRTNLVRHMQLVHGLSERDIVIDQDQEENNSMDEMDEGIHRDGFLKPIKIRKGWRVAGKFRSRRDENRQRQVEEDSRSDNDGDESMELSDTGEQDRAE